MAFNDFFEWVVEEIRELQQKGATPDQVMDQSRALDIYAQMNGALQNGAEQVFGGDLADSLRTKLDQLREMVPGIDERRKEVDRLTEEESERVRKEIGR